MDLSLPPPVAYGINTAKDVLLTARAWVGAKLDRISGQHGLAEYTLLNDNQRSHQVLQDGVSKIPSLFRAKPRWLLPSFIQHWLSPKPRIKSSGTVKISTLDGLRGLACLMVMHMHWSFAVTDSNEGGSAETNEKYLFHRPFFYLSMGWLLTCRHLLRDVRLRSQHQMCKDDTRRPAGPEHYHQRRVPPCHSHLPSTTHSTIHLPVHDSDWYIRQVERCLRRQQILV